MMRNILHRVVIPLAALAPIGCDEVVDDAGDAIPGVEITGKVNVTGETPGDFKFELYSALGNVDAFDTSFCETYEGPGTCYGRVRLNQLGPSEKIGKVDVKGNDFTLSGISADVGYILRVTGDDPNIACSSDFLGMNEDKVVTSESAIVIELDSIDAGRASIACVNPDADVEFPDPDPPEEPEIPVEDDGDIPGPDDGDPKVVLAWSAFTMNNKTGTPVYADAGAGNDVADVVCDDSFPPVMEINGELVDGDGVSEAWIRIQYGAGDDAVYETIATPVVDGAVKQLVALTGGYAVVQLDTNEVLDGVGESYTVTMCEAVDPPVQELLVQITWDKDDTDVDLHVYTRTTSSDDVSEIAYYSMNQPWGDLDIDDIDGYGPETISTIPGDFAGRTYAVRAHYYSDHGNGPVTVTGRAIFYDKANDRICDITATKTLSDGEWWEQGIFGPADCPPLGQP